MGFGRFSSRVSMFAGRIVSAARTKALTARDESLQDGTARLGQAEF
jgi:hypothetical protein